ncbi:hypothetical protein ACFQDQ_18015 [Haladaptatus sp. GCM10026878]|uniref:hypothetical protein n=1 Tax=Haladaptatus sp. GCM10026878 TaxID=3252660 RepID=UPI00360B328D
MNSTLTNAVPEDVAPVIVLFGVLAGLSVGWVGGSVLAGASVSSYLPLLATLLAAGTVVYVVRTGE